MESKYHLKLKSYAIKLLKNMGAVNIQEEFIINGMIVDVVGFKDDELIVVECGALSYPDKIKNLKNSKNVRKVIHLPYLKCIKTEKINIKKELYKFILGLKEKISINELSKQLKISYPSVLKHCDILFAEGKIEIKDYGNIKLVSKLENEK